LRSENWTGRFGRENAGVQDAFGIVLVVVVAFAAVVAIVAFVSSGGAYDQIGRGGLSLGDGADRPPEPAGSPAAAAAEREAEIRQMLEARNARRLRRGEEPIDVEAEVQRRLRELTD
jgi:hypothetical protein